MKYQRRFFSALLCGLLFSIGAISAWGQNYKGSVRVTVNTADGSALPGAVVTLSASTFNRSFVTDANGEVRFVGLTPDRYELKVVMTGFNTVVRPDVIVDTGSNVRLNITLEPSTQTEELVVTAETPLMDSSKTGTRTVLSTEEIEMIPQARDPWAVLDSVPGLQTDRINIGGNESGQQAQWVGKGDNGSNAAWVIDGVEFTDFAAQGASQSYLDFGSFDQIGFETGGTGVESGSSGTVLNFVTKQGSNRHTGSMRLLYADQDFQSTNVNRNNPDNVNPDGSLKQNTIFETFEKGFEIGGPIIKDRLWYWGAFNQNNIKNITINNDRDDTDLENISLKLHGDITSTTRATFFYTVGDKLKFGRGAGPDRAPETTWNQDGPSPIYKYEISQLIGQNTELQFIYGRVDGGFQLQPVGDFNVVQAVVNRELGRWENTIRNSVNNRPRRNYLVKGSTFMATGNMDHEFTYGVEYVEAQADFRSTWGEGSGNVWMNDYSYTLRDSNPNNDRPSTIRYYRDSATSTAIESQNAWLQDSITFGGWTLKGGLRFNRSEGKNLGASINANPFFPEVVPALAYAGDSPQFTWETIAPSIGATYTFGANNQYLLRSSFRRYYDNIGSSDASFINPVGFGFVTSYWDDNNGDGQFQLGEERWILDENGNPDYFAFGFSGIDPDNPASAVSRDKIDPNFDPPSTDEFIIGGEWSITPGFTVGMTATYRLSQDFSWSPFTDGGNGLLTSADFEVVGTFEAVHPITGQTVMLDEYALSEEGRAKNPAFDQILTNRPQYEREFYGLELTVTKRLANRWMLRGHLSFQDWTQNVGPASFQDPTITTGRGNVDGEKVLIASGGSGNKGDVYLGTASYTAYVNGVYQLPWDLAISGSITAREGYDAPLFYNVSQFRDYRGVLVSDSMSAGDPGDLKMDDILLVNLKITKVFKIGSTKVDLGAEIFNLFNDDATLQVERGVNEPVFMRINERLAPRIARFSATINF